MWCMWPPLISTRAALVYPSRLRKQKTKFERNMSPDVVLCWSTEVVVEARTSASRLPCRARKCGHGCRVVAAGGGWSQTTRKDSHIDHARGACRLLVVGHDVVEASEARCVLIKPRHRPNKRNVRRIHAGRIVPIGRSPFHTSTSPFCHCCEGTKFVVGKV